MSKPAKEGREHTLILCVDRDDDLGVKAGIRTPILGRKENLNAAVSLALRDPEEADANALFEAVRIYDRLMEMAKEEEKYEMATISGSELGGVGADRKLVSELTQVLGTFPASDVVLVTDGYSDEAVLPLVQSRVPVTSVRRIVVRQSESIEETAALFSRYFKMLMENPRYSRVLLGVPGIFLIVLVVLWYFDILLYASYSLILIAGVLLFVLGFQVDRSVRGIYRWIQDFSPPPLPTQMTIFSAITGVLLISIGCYQAGAYVASILQPPPVNHGQWIALLPWLTGQFLSQSITLVVIGGCVIMTGRAIRLFIERDARMLSAVVIMVTLAWSRQIFFHASQILIEPTLASTMQWQLVVSIVIGILLSVATFIFAFVLHKRYANFFHKRQEQNEETGGGKSEDN